MPRDCREDVLTPRLIETVFKVKAAVYQDPVTGSMAVSLIGPANGSKPSETTASVRNSSHKGGGI